MPTTPPKKIGHARKLRRRSTKAEERLWARLRRRQLEGAYFRRQHPIGPYVVDFCCSAARLVIEVDGGQHAIKGAEDARRTGFLETKGYRVLRFWNNEVLEDVEGVLAVVREALTDQGHFVDDPPPRPSPFSRERE